MNVLTDSLMIFTDNVVGSDDILSHPLWQPLFKFGFILLRVLFCFFVASKFRIFWWKPHDSSTRGCKVTVL